MTAFDLFEDKKRHSTPCFGEKINAITNIVVAANTMTAPDDKLCSKLTYKPITDDNAPKNEANTLMTQKRFVSKYAAAAGVINIATTSTTPTPCKEATVARVSNT